MAKQPTSQTHNIKQLMLHKIKLKVNKNKTVTVNLSDFFKLFFYDWIVAKPMWL